MQELGHGLLGNAGISPGPEIISIALLVFDLAQKFWVLLSYECFLFPHPAAGPPPHSPTAPCRSRRRRRIISIASPPLRQLRPAPRPISNHAAALDPELSLTGIAAADGAARYKA
jgi:hypothetical protein